MPSDVQSACPRAQPGPGALWGCGHRSRPWGVLLYSGREGELPREVQDWIGLALESRNLSLSMPEASLQAGTGQSSQGGLRMWLQLGRASAPWSLRARAGTAQPRRLSGAGRRCPPRGRSGITVRWVGNVLWACSFALPELGGTWGSSVPRPLRPHSGSLGSPPDQDASSQVPAGNGPSCRP